MNRKLPTALLILAGVLTPALNMAAPPPPPSPEAIEAARITAPAVETGPAIPLDTSRFTAVAESPSIAKAGIRAEVDLRQIPTDRFVPAETYSLSHHQGDLSQEMLPQGGGQNPAVHPGEPTAPIDLSGPRISESGRSTPGTYNFRFDARSFSGWIPPDTQMAVGPEYIVEAMNSGFMVYSKAGFQTRSYTSFTSFVNLPSPWSGFCYDPRVVYSNEYGKFLMMIMGKDVTNLKSYYWLMVSQTSDPNGSWWVWRVNSSAGSAGNEEWLDYAAIGVDHWGVYVTGNYFAFPTKAGGGRTQLWSWPPSFMSGTSGSGYVWTDLKWPSGAQAFTMQPAFPHSQNSSGNTFYVNTYNGSGSQILLWTQSGKRYPADPQAGTANMASVAIDSKQYYAMGNNVDQPGSTWDIDGGGTRVMDATYSNGKVYATLALNWDGNHVYSEVYIIALTTSTGTRAWHKSLFNSNYNMSYPALTVEGSSSSPDVMVAFSMTEPGNPTGYIGTSWYYYNQASDTASWLVERWGDGPYSRWDGDSGLAGDGRNRWGDYSGAEWDWTCGVAWGAAEYATASNTWGTQIFSRTLGSSDPCAYLHVQNPNGGETHGAGDSVTIHWDRTNISSSDDLYLELWNGSTWTVIAGPLSYSSTSYSWSVPNINTSQAKIYVGAWDSGTSSWSVSDTSDNIFTIAGKADLRWSTFTPPASALQGEQISVGNSVANDGVIGAGSFTIEFRLSTNTFCSGGDPLIGSRNISSLSAGSAQGTTTALTIPAGASTGTQYLCMMVDRSQAVDDFDLANNDTYQAIQILPAAIFSDGFESGGTTGWSSSTP